MSDNLDGIPTPLLTGVFSHARAIHKLLHEFVTENGFVGVSSYDAIKQELDYLKSDLEQVGELIPELPETIRVELKAVAEIVNDALCNISFADVCQSFLESDIEAHGKRGWREVVRLKNPPAIGWAKPAADDDVAGGGKGDKPYSDPPKYARDKWIYENIECNSYPGLQLKLKEIANRERFDVISSRPGFKKAADRYADYHNLPQRRFRQTKGNNS